MTNWCEQIDTITQNFNSAFGELTADELNEQPLPGKWGIAQHIDHLIVLNNSYLAMIEACRKGTHQPPWLANLGFIPAALGNMLLKAVQPSNPKRTQTFPMWEPRQEAFDADILGQFEQHQVWVKQAITDSKDLLKAGAIISSPANRYIVIKLATVYDILISHEQRHYELAYEVCQSLANSS